MAIKPLITAERLRELLHYDPETGIFRRLAVPTNRVKSCDIAGTPDDKGYLLIKIDLRMYKAHRLAWLYMTGAWPEDKIDHIDLDKANNRFVNLREATDSQNEANKRMLRNNTSGYRGVSWHKRDKKWIAQIWVAGKKRHLGYSDCPAAAHFAYIVAADMAFGEFARFS